MAEQTIDAEDLGRLSGGKSPLYQQIAAQVASAIAARRFAPGEKLPPEDQLGQHFGVSMITIRAALRELATAGLIERKQGRGTFVKGALGPVWAIGSVEDLKITSRFSDTTVVSSGYVKAPQWASILIGDNAATRLYSIKITRSRDGVPFLLTDAFYPSEIGIRLAEQTPVDDLRRNRLLVETVEERVGKRIAVIRQQMSAIAAPAKVAKLLKIRTSAPVLLVTRVSVTREGHVLQVARSYYRSDRFSYSVNLQRKAQDG